MGDETVFPFGGRPPESVYLAVDPLGQTNGLVSWLERVLPTLNWRSHVFVLGRDGPVGTARAEELSQVVAGFLRRQRLGSIIVHPVLEMSAATVRPWRRWRPVLEVAEPFQKEAFEEQTEARLLIAPIIVPRPDVTPTAMARAAAFLRSHFATPSFYLRELPPGPFDTEVRRYLDPDGEGVIEQLTINHVFESLLERIDDEADESRLLEPCRRHWVADAASGEVYACLRQWSDGQSAATLDSDAALDEHGPIPEHKCAGCVGRSTGSMRRHLVANGREGEGQRVCAALAHSLSARSEHGLAADLARCAFELSHRNEDRAAALIHEGLCRLDLGALEEAEEALALAATYATDPGVVAYHRGRVQFAWRDYIEALERFEEALASGSEQIPREHMCFQMALSHINLEEYPEARGYLERCELPGEESAPVAFYRGICDLGEGHVKEAMAHFEEALQRGPADEDLGRVLFYVGTCQKELGHFDEAIETLKKAVEVDPEDLPNHNLLGFCYYKTK